MPIATDPVQFDYATAQRLIRDARSWEAYTGLTKQRRQPPVIGLTSFWARITGINFSTGQYSWVAEQLATIPSGGGFSYGFSTGFGGTPSFTTFSDDSSSGTGSTTESFAKEVNDFKFVYVNAKVLLYPAPNYYVFSWGHHVVKGTTAGTVTGSGGTGSVNFVDASANTQTVTVNNDYVTLSSNVACHAEWRYFGGAWGYYLIAGDCS